MNSAHYWGTWILGGLIAVTALNLVWRVSLLWLRKRWCPEISATSFKADVRRAALYLVVVLAVTIVVLK